VQADYGATSHYPVLYQLSPMSIKVDSILSQTGNPDLIPALRHSASVRLSWRDRLTVEPSFHFTHHAVSESYIKSGYKPYRTFMNIDTKEYALYGSYSHSPVKHVRLTGNVTFYHSRAIRDVEENALNGWIAGVEALYYNPAKNAGVMAGYYRNMKKHILWQGYQMLDKDIWLVEVNKLFPRQGISVRLSWIPPLAPGIRDEQIKRMDTPLYKETTRIYLGACYNMVLLNVSYRFDTGARPAKGRPAPARKGEREERQRGF
jgi:hypothetical protein